MNYDASHAGSGKRLPNLEGPAVERLTELQQPVLAIVGEQDFPYMHAAVVDMGEKISDSRSVTIEDAAHLPNMDQPETFERVLRAFFGAKIGYQSSSHWAYDSSFLDRASVRPVGVTGNE